MDHEIHEKHENNGKIVYKEESFAIQGAIFEVYREMGCGFLEAVYQECLERELASRGMCFRLKPSLEIQFKGKSLTKRYVPDLIVAEGIVVELKAVQRLAPEHEAQLLNYLRATRKKVGYLINFGASGRLEWKRMVL